MLGGVKLLQEYLAFSCAMDDASQAVIGRVESWLQSLEHKHLQLSIQLAAVPSSVEQDLAFAIHLRNYITNLSIDHEVAAAFSLTLPRSACDADHRGA